MMDGITFVIETISMRIWCLASILIHFIIAYTSNISMPKEQFSVFISFNCLYIKHGNFLLFPRNVDMLVIPTLWRQPFGQNSFHYNFFVFESLSCRIRFVLLMLKMIDVWFNIEQVLNAIHCKKRYIYQFPARYECAAKWLSSRPSIWLG